jgi:site-specific recombinase XerD
MNHDVPRVTDGLPQAWATFLVDWDRSLRSGNYPATTRYNYLLAAAQLGRYLIEQGRHVEAGEAARTPTAVVRRHVEAFQTWMIESRSAATALNKHKALQQFFKWLMVDEEEIDHSPMLRVRQPRRPTKLVPIISAEETGKLLDTCKGRNFVHVRDEAIIRLLANTGAPGRQLPHRRARAIRPGSGR